LPAANNKLADVLGDQLPAGANESSATVVQLWDQDNQTFPSTQRYFLSNDQALPGWRQSGTWADASGVTLDPNKGMVITIRSGSPTLRMAGFVPTGSEVQTVATGGASSAGGYTLAASAFPTTVPLGNSGLLTSGFTGGLSLATSDNLLFWNTTSGKFDTRIYYRTTDGTWRDSTGAITSKTLQPGEAFQINRRINRGSFTWTLPVPYTTPVTGP
jgi:hypothetical protein